MDDKELQAKRAEAKAAGYSDEEIDAFLKPTPVAGSNVTAGGISTSQQLGPRGTVQTSPTPFVDRSAEETGLIQGMGAQAGKYALEGAAIYGAYRGAKSLMGAAGQAFRGGPPAGVPTTVPTPTAGPMTAPPAGPTTFTGGANPAFDKALARPYNPAMPQGAPAAPAQPTAGNFIERMSNLASRYATTAGEVATRALPAARAMTGAGAMLYSRGLNTGEDEMLARIRQAQAAGQPMPQVPYQGQ